MEKKMRKTLFTLAMILCLAAVASVASIVAKNSNNQPAPDEKTIVGYISDQACATKMGDHAAKDEHEACAAKCIKEGSEAVLLTMDGKIYKLDQQDKVSQFAGKKVEVTGNVSGNSISVTSIKRQ